jgi:hypothetical protein
MHNPYPKVKVSDGNIWDEYEPVQAYEDEDLGSGMCSTVTKARLKGTGEDGQIFFVKKCSEEMIWTADNEAPGLEVAGNVPGVV